MKKAWAWLKKWGGLLFGGIASFLLLILGSGWVYRRQKQALADAENEAVIAKAVGEIEQLKKTRAEVVERIGETDKAVGQIDRLIAVQKRRVVEASGGEGMSDDELEEAFKRVLGGG